MMGTTISYHEIPDRLDVGGWGKACNAQDTRLNRILAPRFHLHELIRDVPSLFSAHVPVCTPLPTEESVSPRGSTHCDDKVRFKASSTLTNNPQNNPIKETAMRTSVLVLGVLLLILLVSNSPAQTAAKEKPWSVQATFLDACSCNLLCPCFFNTHPDKDFCKYNTAIKIEKGNYGEVKLNGMKVWMSGDMGADFSSGELKSMYLTFEPSATQEQVDAAMKVLSLVAPMKAKDTGVDRAPIVWEMKDKTAYAKLGDGQGEVSLSVVIGKDGKKPVVLTNIAMGAEKKNNGYTLAKSKHHYKGHGLDYAFEGTSGGIYEVESSGGGEK